MRSSTFLMGAMAQAAYGAIEPKNFIFVIPDGFGPASQTLTRAYLELTKGNSTIDTPDPEMLPADLITVGNTRTHSADDWVTDSAAAGTALATGWKTNNGFLGLLPDKQPIGSVLEAAKHNGLRTGLVVTSIINHATPAGFSAHVDDRNSYDIIAKQQIGYDNPLNQSVDLMMGGGRCYFKPDSDSDSCREDDVDLFAFAEEQGYTVAQNRADYEEHDVELPYLGLFSDSHLAYELDRQQQDEEEREPALHELTKAALAALNKDNDKGFFMMIEASRIDHAAHANDVASHIYDIIEFNKVIDVVTKFIDENPDTAMIATADHETGGVTMPANYDPQDVAKATHSTEYLTDLWEEYDGDDKAAYLKDTIFPAHGIEDGTDEEVEAVMEADDFAVALGEVLGDRVGVKWTTTGHSAVDTVLYGYAAGKMGDQLKLDLAGNWENTDMPRYIADSLGVSLDEVTELLRA